MPTFELTTPDGATYEVDAPDENAALGALGAAGLGGAPKTAPKKVYSGTILPLSRYENGDVQFDSDAGLIGAAKHFFTGGAQMTGDVMSGKESPTSDTTIGRAFDTAIGAAPVNPAFRAGDRAIAGAGQAFKNAKIKTPTAEALREAADKGYDTVRSAGVDYSSAAVSDLAGSVKGALEADGVIAELAPKTHSILDKLNSPPDGSVAPIAGLEAARRALGKIAQGHSSPDPIARTDAEAARRGIERLDEFIARPDEASVVAGPAADAAKALKDARGNYAASKRSDTLTGIEEAADLRAAAANSGQNLDNTIRSRLASLLLNPKAKSGFTEEELKAIETIVRGNLGRNATRGVGNLLGGGGGLGAAVSGTIGGVTGGALGGPLGAAVGATVPLIGNAAKRGANRMTRKALERADEMTRKRSPLYEQMLKDAPKLPISAEKRAALVRALVLSMGRGPVNDPALSGRQ